MNGDDPKDLLEAAAALRGSMDSLGGELRDLFSSADGLRERLSGIEGEVHAVETRVGTVSEHSGRNRRLIRLLAVSVAFDVLLSVVVGFGFIRVNDTAHKAEKASSAAVVICLTDNRTNATQRRLWDYILTLTGQSRAATLTDAEREERRRTAAQFKSYLSSAFPQKDCAHL